MSSPKTIKTYRTAKIDPSSKKLVFVDVRPDPETIRIEREISKLAQELAAKMFGKNSPMKVKFSTLPSSGRKTKKR